MKRVLLFLATNLAVMLVLGIVANVLGLNRFLTAEGLDLGTLLGFAALIGFGGAFISLLISKPMAKWTTRAQVINDSPDPTHRWIVASVKSFSDKAGIQMPEVGIFEGEPNAFATGAFKNSALVAVSTGLLQRMSREEVEAVILSVNHEEEKVSLGIKQLYEDPWERIPMDYPLGQVRDVKVIKITDFGAFVELEPGIEGLIHVSELSNERIDDPRKVIQEGATVKAEIITVDTAERKIGLSIKSLIGREEDGDLTEYKKSESKKSSNKATLGDLLMQQMGEGKSSKDAE